ncbi:MAG: ABC transporter permease subunit, partial [Clostridia bacterium]|nr:ABC transporter permease subunit [Clostridia bacterium]
MSQFFNSIAQQFNRTFIVDNRYKYFLTGFQNTIIIALVATLVGIIIGMIVAVVKVMHQKTGKLKILNALFELYTTVIRGTPVVLQLLISYN